MGYFLSFLLFIFPVFSYDIIVNGSGIVGIWTAYNLSNELEKVGLGGQVQIHLVSQVDWQEKPKGEVLVFDKEPSGWGPVGLQLEEDVPWNAEDLRSSIAVSDDLGNEEKRATDLFFNWHKREGEKERIAHYSQMREFVKGQWFDFRSSLSPEERENLHFALEGAWALKDNYGAILTLMEEQRGTGMPCLHSDELAKKLPFYASYILENGIKGVFIADHGMIDSWKLREWMWGKLLEKRGGKPRVVLHLKERVASLLVLEGGICYGVQFEDGSLLHADLTIMATGYGTKALVNGVGIDLPLSRLWGAVIKADLKEEAIDHFPGPLGLNSMYITLLNNKHVAAINGGSMFIPEGAQPDPSLFKERLKNALLVRYQDKIDLPTIQYYVAPRIVTPDELPVIDLEKTVSNLLILLPTYHLGLTQSIALAKLATLHTLNKLGFNQTLPLSLEPYSVDRFTGL